MDNAFSLAVRKRMSIRISKRHVTHKVAEARAALAASGLTERISAPGLEC
jgi:hypothetical protein